VRHGLLIWSAVIAVLSAIVGVQVAMGGRPDVSANADTPTVQPGVDLLAGIKTVPTRVRDYGYQRAAFGDAWDDNSSAPGGHNGCDTRNDILNRDLLDKTYVSIRRCPDAVATGTLRDPYTNETVVFIRGNQVGASVQIDHIVPLAYAWDMGARDWPADVRLRFANDPANLLAVSGKANQDKGDQPPGSWMPQNTAFWCQYSIQFADVLRGYRLGVDQVTAEELRKAAASCPVG
jgi:hypothetical protein